MIQTQEKCKKPHFGPELGSLGPNSGRQNFFIKLVPMQFKGKLMNQA